MPAMSGILAHQGAPVTRHKADPIPLAGDAGGQGVGAQAVGSSRLAYRFLHRVVVMLELEELEAALSQG